MNPAKTGRKSIYNMGIILSVAWIAFLFLSVSVSLTPLISYIIWAAKFQSIQLYVLIALGIPLCLTLSFLLLIGIAYLWSHLLPKTPNGRFKLLQDQGSTIWALNNAVPTLYLKWFQSTFFLNEHIRYLLLKAFNCDVQKSSWITSNAHISDLRNLHFGKNVIIGEHVTITASLQPRPNSLIIADVYIGDNSMIGGLSGISPGVSIGNDAKIGVNTLVGPSVTIGNGVTIGANTSIAPNCTIGNKVRIGISCTLIDKCTIPDNMRIPKGTTVTKAYLEGRELEGQNQKVKS